MAHTADSHPQALSGTQLEYIANIRSRAAALRQQGVLDSTVASCSEDLAT